MTMQLIRAPGRTGGVRSLVLSENYPISVYTKTTKNKNSANKQLFRMVIAVHTSMMRQLRWQQGDRLQIFADPETAMLGIKRVTIDVTPSVKLAATGVKNPGAFSTSRIYQNIAPEGPFKIPVSKLVSHNDMYFDDAEGMFYVNLGKEFFK